MKLQLTASALIFALAGTASFAQGMEGQRIGYHDAATSAAINAGNDTASVVTVEKYDPSKDGGNLRAEDLSESTLTVYATPRENLKDGPFSR